MKTKNQPSFAEWLFVQNWDLCGYILMSYISTVNSLYPNSPCPMLLWGHIIRS